MEIKPGDYIERIITPGHEDHNKISYCNDEQNYYIYYRILKIDNQKLYLYEDPYLRTYPIFVDFQEVQKPYIYHSYSVVSDNYELDTLNNSAAERLCKKLINSTSYDPATIEEIKEDYIRKHPRFNAVSIEFITRPDHTGHLIHAGTKYTWDDYSIFFPENAVYYTGRSWEIIK